MRIKILRFTFFVLSILAVDFAVTGCSNEMDPMKKQSDKPVPKPTQQITVPQVTKQVTEQTTEQTTEKKDIRLTDKTGTPFEKMSASQIAQIKRSDCRFKKEVIPHDYKK
ncbi:hypothetical protein KKHLCK_09295 [Candidatus Electrothrix laxa]